MIAEDEVASSAEQFVDEPTEEVTVRRLERWIDRLATIHPAAWFTAAGALLFALVFATLGVQHHRNFGTWSYDMGIYDQGFWLVSRGGQSFMTVRGLEFWGHHLNLIVLAYVPFYWLGAGPHFLYLVETVAMAAGAIPIWLFASDRFEDRWLALAPAGAYLMFPSLEWINWWHFHPDALIITPLL